MAIEDDSGVTVDDDRSSLEDARRELAGLFSDAADLVSSEFDYWRLRARYSAEAIRRATIFAIGALLMLACAAIGLVVGLLLILAYALGIVWATVILSVALFAIAAALALMSKRQLSRLSFADDGDYSMPHAEPERNEADDFHDRAIGMKEAAR